MSILNSMGMGQLQTLQHVLQEMEGDGINSLAEAREAVAKEYGRKRGRRVALGKASAPPRPIAACPHCSSPLTPVFTGDDTAILGCRKCRYSRLVEV